MLGSAASATTLVVMSRSVVTPTSFSTSVIGSEQMCSSRISRAASTTDADAPIERGFFVIASRTLFAIVPPLLFCAILARLLSDRERAGGRRHEGCRARDDGVELALGRRAQGRRKSV